MLVIYVFSKDGLIKCLGNLAYEHLELLDDGWIHTATLDPCRYIESLHNDQVKSCLENVRSLSIVK
jgi:hypothetical protein